MESNNDMAWLRERLDKLDDKQDKMNEVLIKNTLSLEEHMRRTSLLESEVKRVDGEVKPLKMRDQFFSNVSKIISVVVAAVLAAHSLGLF